MADYHKRYYLKNREHFIAKRAERHTQPKGRYFCGDKCAVRQGYAAAHHGYRFRWSK